MLDLKIKKVFQCQKIMQSKIQMSLKLTNIKNMLQYKLWPQITKC